MLDDDYRRLICCMSECAALVQVVVRDDISLSEAAQALLSELQLHGAAVRRVTEWPGTQLLQGEASLVQLRTSSASAELVSHAAKSLYAWVQPNLPEDLAFLRLDGSPMLFVTAHECDAGLSLTAEEAQALDRCFPDWRMHFQQDLA
jgi:hypothetical protein